MSYTGKWSRTVRREVNLARHHAAARRPVKYARPDQSLDDWDQPLLRSPVRREDFDPAGPPVSGDVPATAVRGGAEQGAPANSSGRRVHPPFAA